MADWSQIPRDLLETITKRMDTSTDLLRFRSVCSTWRSSVVPRARRLSSAFQILPNDGIANTSFGFYLSKRIVYLIGLPNSPHLGNWLVKIEEDVPERKRLVNPLSRCPLKSDALPKNFPRVLDLRKVMVKELGQEYVLHHISYRPNATSFTDAGNLYMEKVVMMWLDELNSESEFSEFMLLTIHVSGKLAIFKSGDRRWTIIGEMDSPYDDVVVHKGKLFGVDNTGKVVSVGKDADLTVAANPVFGGDKKYLVQSKGELLLVDMYLSIDTGDDNSDTGEEFMEHLAQYMRERTVRFKVYKLDEEQKTWVEVGSLPDTVLFLGDDSTFAASSSDLYGGNGNCIFFVDNFFYAREIGGLAKEDDGMWAARDIGVFELETGCIGPLVNYPEYYKIFWPPPGWLLTSQEVGLERQVEGLSLRS
ncbi:F-box protein SKIP23 [Linum grandiflorum]